MAEWAQLDGLVYGSHLQGCREATVESVRKRFVVCQMAANAVKGLDRVVGLAIATQKTRTGRGCEDNDLGRFTVTNIANLFAECYKG